MKRLLYVLPALVLVAGTASADDMSATLTPGAVAGGGAAPDGQGFAALRVTGNTVEYNILVNGMGTPTRAFIGQGAPGTPGSTFLELDAGFSGSASAVGSVSSSDAGQLDDDTANFFVQVDSAAGSVRGQLANASGAEVQPGTLQLTQSELDVSEDAGTLTVSVERVGGSGGAVSVGYATADGSAVAGTDYNATSGTLDWADGDTAVKTFQVTILDNGLEQGQRQFTVNLSNAGGGATLGSPASATVFINDDDISFDECVEGPTTLCLNEGRFRVTTTFAAPGEPAQNAPRVTLTDDTGYHWFFDEDNIEVVVKVLDACVDPFNRFWVFISGLTNVEVNILVVDTQAERVKTYNNPQGTPFVSIQDTDAFDTCP